MNERLSSLNFYNFKGLSVINTITYITDCFNQNATEIHRIAKFLFCVFLCVTVAIPDSL